LLWRRGLFALLLLLGLMGGFWFGVRGPDNLHAVREGVVYRAAQMNGGVLAETIRAEGIKSILNLRGAKPDSHWFQQEMAVAEAHKVQHLDCQLSALKDVPPETLEAILKLVDAAPKPLLIHCEGGADRTGLVVAAWVFSREHVQPEAAHGQLSLRYGHFPYLWSRSGAMDRSYWDYVRQAEAGARQP
jgi:undecaprenyl-diphosphatase